MKTKKELEILKGKVEELKSELRELSEEELRAVVGGVALPNELIQIIGIGGGGMIFTPTDDISPDTQGNAGGN